MLSERERGRKRKRKRKREGEGVRDLRRARDPRGGKMLVWKETCVVNVGHLWETSTQSGITAPAWILAICTGNLLSASVQSVSFLVAEFVFSLPCYAPIAIGHWTLDTGHWRQHMELALEVERKLRSREEWCSDLVSNLHRIEWEGLYNELDELH